MKKKKCLSFDICLQENTINASLKNDFTLLVCFSEMCIPQLTDEWLLEAVVRCTKNTMAIALVICRLLCLQSSGNSKA